MAAEIDTSANDHSAQLQQAVEAARSARQPLAISGNGSKNFLSPPVTGLTSLSTTEHRGVMTYEPTELVVTARAGTPLQELQTTLAESGQMLPFEPPSYANDDTLGGVIACGLSGPRRPYSGSARDYVLGVRVLNGQAESLRFGGEVMKNVAGYDVARLQVGARGTLGLLLDISLKVLPLPEREATTVIELDQADDLSLVNSLARRPLPLSASAIIDRHCYLRFSGSEAAVSRALSEIGGSDLDSAGADQTASHFWASLSNQQHTFFAAMAAPATLWRVSVPAYAPALAGVSGQWLYEWGGAQRWLISRDPAESVFKAAAAAGGYATAWRVGDAALDTAALRYQPLQGVTLRLHQRLRQAFDPLGLFNPGRYHVGLDGQSRQAGGV